MPVRRSPRSSLIAASVLALVSARTTVATAEPSARDGGASNAPKHFSVGPVPEWVVRADRVPAPEPRDSPNAADRGELVDDQVRLGPTTAHYRRRLVVVGSAAGMDRAPLRIPLSPGASVVLHTISVTRDGTTRDALAKARLVEEPAVLDEGSPGYVYDSGTNVIVAADDVRPGDLVETEYTVLSRERHPYVDRFAFAFATEVSLVQARFLVPSAVAPGLGFRPAGDEIPHVERALGGYREHVFRATPAPAAAEDPDLGPSVLAPRELGVSAYPSWARVAEEARAAFLVDAPPGPAIVAKIAEISRLPTKPERALAAVRFVQDEIANVEVEGEDVRPHPLEKIVIDRVGDYRDKAALLVVLLRALGYRAYPALASSAHGHALASVLPTDIFFDRALVAIDADGKRAFVDPSVSYQGGSFDDRVAYDEGYVLALAPGAATLERAPVDELAEPTIVVRESYRVRPDRVSATLTVTHIYRRAMANGLRTTLANDGEHGFEGLAIARSEAAGRKIKAIAPFEVHDDRAANVIETIGHYEVPTLFVGGRAQLPIPAVSDALLCRRTTPGKAPLRFVAPYFARHEITIDPGAAELVAPRDETIDALGFGLRVRTSKDGNATKLVYEVRAKLGEIPARDVAAHLESVRVAQPIVHPSIALGGVAEVAPQANAPTIGLAPAIGIGVGMAATIGLVVFVRSRRRDDSAHDHES